MQQIYIPILVYVLISIHTKNTVHYLPKILKKVIVKQLILLCFFSSQRPDGVALVVFDQWRLLQRLPRRARGSH